MIMYNEVTPKFTTPMNGKQMHGNVFTEEGRLSQAEFAIKNVSEAGTIIGIACTNGVILIGVNPQKSTSIEKIYKVSEKVHLAVSGVFSDALRLLKYARLESVKIKEELGKYPKLSVLCDNIAKEKQYYTQMAGARPFGVSFLYAGYEDDEYVLYSTDPSGTVNKWKACSFGMDSDAINSCLRGEIDTLECNLNDGLYKILRIYAKAKEWNSDLSERLEIHIFGDNDNRLLTSDEIKSLISEIESEKRQSQ